MRMRLDSQEGNLEDLGPVGLGACCMLCDALTRGKKHRKGVLQGSKICPGALLAGSMLPFLDLKDHFA